MADLTTALQAFKDATVALGAAWNPADGDAFGATYPGYLPDFDQFVCDVLAMKVDLRDKPKRTVVVTYTGELDAEADAALEEKLISLPFVADIEVHYEDMIERGGH